MLRKWLLIVSNPLIPVGRVGYSQITSPLRGNRATRSDSTATQKKQKKHRKDRKMQKKVKKGQKHPPPPPPPGDTRCYGKGDSFHSKDLKIPKSGAFDKGGA